MARERMVTRTIIESKVTAMVCDTKQGVCSDKVFKLTAVNDADVALKLLKKHFDTDEQIIVTVKSIEVSEVLYGMPEIDFIKYAQPMESYFKKG